MSILVKTFSHKLHENQHDLKKKYFFSKKMKGKNNFSSRGSSLNDISLYLKPKKARIHHRKVLDSLCSRSCIVPFNVLQRGGKVSIKCPSKSDTKIYIHM